MLLMPLIAAAGSAPADAVPAAGATDAAGAEAQLPLPRTVGPSAHSSAGAWAPQVMGDLPRALSFGSMTAGEHEGPWGSHHKRLHHPGLAVLGEVRVAWRVGAEGLTVLGGVRVVLAAVFAQKALAWLGQACV